MMKEYEEKLLKAKTERVESKPSRSGRDIFEIALKNNNIHTFPLYLEVFRPVPKDGDYSQIISDLASILVAKKDI